MEITEEQKVQIRKIKRNFFLGCILTSWLYLVSLFASNFLLIVVDELYVHNKSFIFYSVLGTTVIIFLGWRHSLEELYRDADSKLKKVL